MEDEPTVSVNRVELSPTEIQVIKETNKQSRIGRPPIDTKEVAEIAKVEVVEEEVENIAEPEPEPIVITPESITPIVVEKSEPKPQPPPQLPVIENVKPKSTLSLPKHPIKPAVYKNDIDVDVLPRTTKVDAEIFTPEIEYVYMRGYLSMMPRKK